jgi:telomere length regulation protein
MIVDVMAEDLTQLKLNLSDNITDLQTLLELLCGPLQSAGLLPPQFRKYSNSTHKNRNVLKHYPSIQGILLEKILPSWNPLLAERGLSAIVDQYFCPDMFSFASDVAGQVVVMSYSTILSTPFNEFSIRFLSRLAREYPIDRLHQAVFDAGTITWEDCVRNIIIVPTKVANFLVGKAKIPDDLEHGGYFNHLCLRTENLVHTVSAQAVSTGISNSHQYSEY